MRVVEVIQRSEGDIKTVLTARSRERITGDCPMIYPPHPNQLPRTSMSNMTQTGRYKQRTGNALLTANEVRVIKRKLLDGVSPRQLAETYNVGLETVRRISRGDSWNWLEPAENQLEISPEELAVEAAAGLERMKGWLKKEGLMEEPAIEVSANPVLNKLLKAVKQQPAKVEKQLEGLVKTDNSGESS